MPNDCKTLFLLLWRLHQTGKSSGSVYFFPGVSPVYLKTTHSHSLQLMSFVGGWMGNWLHTKVIKAYWSRHLLSILRPTSFILVLRRDAAACLVSQVIFCCQSFTCHTQFLHFCKSRRWWLMRIRCTTTESKLSAVPGLLWLSLLVILIDHLLFMRFYYPNGCDRHCTPTCTGRDKEQKNNNNKDSRGRVADLWALWQPPLYVWP